MTDSIDLDEMDVESDDEPDANKGDWVWRDDGDPDAEPKSGWLDDVGDGRETDSDDGGDVFATPESAEGPNGDGTEDATDDSADEPEADGNSGRDRLPGVPRQNSDKPVGVPMESGGAGGAAAADQGESPASAVDHGADPAGEGGTGSVTGGDQRSAPSPGDERTTPRSTGDDESEPAASGPHGGGVDDMTMALTYDAVRRLDDPRFAVIDAKAWTDWIGIVGDVPAYEINSFQREHEIDADFFSGAGQEPAERLADVDEHSMFYAERMVLVGVEGEEAIADRAGWEFVPLETAAEKADWELSDEG